MSNAKMKYFEQEDILHLTISDEPEANSVEINPNPILRDKISLQE